MLKITGLILLLLVVFTGLLASCAKTPESTTPTSTLTKTPTVTLTPSQTQTPAPTKTETPAPTSITVTDQYDRTVTIKSNPQRIISLSPAHTEILFALGLGDRIVGVSDYSDYPPEAKTKPNIGSYDAPNIEKIIAAEPDLVLATEEHMTEVTELESHGITVVALNPKTVREVLDTIEMIGKITGQDKQATSLVANLKQRMNAIAEKTSKLTAEQKPRVFYIIWSDPIWTAGSGTFHDELIRMAGGINIASDLTGYADISLEAVIAANPQVMIAGVGMGTDNDVTLLFAQTEARLKDTDARVNGKVFSVNMDIVSRPGPRIVDALEELLKIIHPELISQP
jgi:iron complex transport system substrate-binding protein